MTHPGTVLNTKPGLVRVQIESVSACAACQAHSRCGFAESKTKTLDIPVKPKENSFKFKAGDNVMVTIDEKRGLMATWWAYVLPAILLLAAVIGFSLASLSEPLVILLSLAILALYILLLILFRQKINNKFTLTVEPLNP